MSDKKIAGENNQAVESEEVKNDQMEADTVENEVRENVDDTEKSVEEQLQDANAEIADLKDKLLRLAADYENYKKRNERERATILKYAGEHIFKEILSAVDNLERAISQGVVDGADADKNLAGLLEGVELTLKRFHASLEKFEVTPINSVGEPFDPTRQEALTMEPSDEVPANHVLAEFERGYFYKDRLLRAAKVVVSSGKAKD